MDEYSPSGLTEHRFERLLSSSKMQQSFPETAQAFRAISAEFLRPEDEVLWQNVGNSCRQVLIDFCVEVISVTNISGLANPKMSDVKNLSREIIREVHGPGQFNSG